MKPITILLLFCAFNARATFWYVAKEASGLNNGTSWANAWTAFSSISWSSIQAGDTLWLSGGPVGGTNAYVGDMVDSGYNPGTAQNPVRIKVAQDGAHGGYVLMYGTIQFDGPFKILDGSASTWQPTSVKDPQLGRIQTNCNWEVRQTNQTAQGNPSMGINLRNGLGDQVLFMHVSQVGNTTGADRNGIQFGSGTYFGCIVRGCWVHDCWGFGIDAEMGSGTATNFQTGLFEFNCVERVHDNYTQIDSGIIRKNVMRYWIAPSVGHPDTMQDMNQYIIAYDNIFSDSPGTGYYVEANNALSHDMLCYNNVFYSTTNAYHDGVTITGHDNEQGQACNISNFWAFNNTWYNLGPGQPTTVLQWNRGNRPTGTVSNFNFWNNLILQIAPQNGGASIQLFTNSSVINGIYGFTYQTSDAQINFNDISGGTSFGNGIVYGGLHGDPSSSGYASMAAFAADFPMYNSNNNSTVTLVSLTNFDFRLGADLNASKGMGTNLSTYLAAYAPEYTNDILGNARPQSGAWDIGAYQSDPRLKLWLTANNNQFVDDSGNTNTSWQGNPTNTVYFTNAVDGLGIGYFTNGDHPAGGAWYLGCYLYNTNATNLFLTNGTISLWAHANNGSYSESYLMDAGYDATFTPSASNSFAIKRTNHGPSADVHQFSFLVYDLATSGGSNVVQWPIDADSTFTTTNFHLYTVTFSCTNHTAIAYYDGQPVMTNSVPGTVPFIQPWNYLCIGAWHHGNPPIWVGTFPNAGYFSGIMDDIRIYNQALSAAEVAGLFNGAGSVSGGGGGPIILPPPFGTIQINGTTSETGKTGIGL